MPEAEVSPAQKRWNDANHKRGEDARKRAEERAARTAKAAEEGEGAVAWPYAGLIAPPQEPLLHVIPAGMWSYQEPQTPALESMVPPNDEADPNFKPEPEPEHAGHMPPAGARQAARADHAPTPQRP